MIDEEFHAGLIANPSDDGLRAVYADWLEEQGDPRSEYLRLQLNLRTAAEQDGIRSRLRVFRQQVDVDWWSPLTKTAVLANIHANLPALHAVEQDAISLGAERFVCLGNLFAKGPHPIACYEWVTMHCDFWLRGMWDHYLFNPEDFASSATHSNETLRWHGELVRRMPELHRDVQSAISVRRSPLRREGLHTFAAETFIGYGACFVHENERGGATSPSRSQREFHALKAQSVAGFFDGNYKQWIVHEDTTATLAQHDECIALPAAGEPRILIDVGSVGLPGDRDTRAGYAIVEGNRCRFRRVEYDMTDTLRDLENATELSAAAREWMVTRHRAGV